MMKKGKKEHEMWAAVILLIVGLLFLSRDLGYTFVPAGISIWHVLVTLLGLKMLMCK